MIEYLTRVFLKRGGLVGQNSEVSTSAVEITNNIKSFFKKFELSPVVTTNYDGLKLTRF